MPFFVHVFYTTICSHSLHWYLVLGTQICGVRVFRVRDFVERDFQVRDFVERDFQVRDFVVPEFRVLHLN